jgi:hypothetical protein
LIERELQEAKAKNKKKRTADASTSLSTQNEDTAIVDREKTMRRGYNTGIGSAF